MSEPNPSNEQANSPKKSEKKPKNVKKIVGLSFFVVGIITLVFGLIFLLIDVFKKPDIRDAEYLVSVGTWQLQDTPEVVWDFTEIGKGTLTTNSHTNDYEFKWRMDDDVLKVETSWLYVLNNEFTYELNQNEKTLTLTDKEGTYVFVPKVEESSEEEAAS